MESVQLGRRKAGETGQRDASPKLTQCARDGAQVALRTWTEDEDEQEADRLMEVTFKRGVIQS